ncbi:MAG: glycosyltransferase [Candidatus Bathyarchaeia archaeon]
MARVLFIASLQSEPRVLGMAGAAREEGHAVHVLEWDRTGELPATEFKNGIFFLRYKRASKFGLKAFPHFFNWILFQILHLMRNDYDVIHPQNLDSLMPTLFSIYLKRRRKNVRIIYDIADFYADAYLNFPVVRNIVAQLERALARNVEALTLVSPKQLIQLRGSTPSRVEVVYNSPMSALKEYAEPDTPRGRLRLVYVGTFDRYRARYLERIAEILEGLPVELAIYGFGEFEGKIRELSERFSSHVRFFGRIKPHRVQDAFLGADLVISYLDPRESPNHAVALPNKFLHSLSVGRPVLVAEGTYLAELCRSYGVGISVDIWDEDSVSSLIRALRELSEDKGPLVEMGKRALHLFNELFSWERARGRYVSLLREVLGTRCSD